jgi:hypothetical protein
MKRTDSARRHPFVSIAIGVVAVTALSACATTTPGRAAPPVSGPVIPSPSPSISVDPTSSISAGPIVVRVSTTASSGTGVTAKLVLTVHAARALTAGERTRLGAECSGWENDFPAGIGLPVDVSSTMVSGTWPAGHPVGIVASYLSDAHGYTAATAWTGNGWTEMRAACSEGAAVIPGSASGIILINPKAPVDAQSWGGGSWGFAQNIDVQDPKSAHLVTMSHCSIEVGPAGLASKRLSAMKASSATNGCEFGAIH